MRFIICLLFLATGALCFPGEQDEVKSLPGLDFPINYRHYSGYLQSIKQTYLHYWFFESQTGHSHQDPVVVWLNGGPGCSSLFGEMSENGPIHFNDDGTLSPNKYTWNEKVNVLYLESPAAVGFSYRLNQKSVATDDIETAQVNFAALQSFFAKFPHLAKNDFYLTGESYAGFYIPTLTMLVLDNKYPQNFKGIAIGDGLLDWNNVNDKENFGKRYHGQVKQNIGKEIEDWINQADVKQSLHINQYSSDWQECNYDVLDTYNSHIYENMTSQLKRIINQGNLKTMIYHGEQDPLISFPKNKQYVDNLGYKNLTAFVPWYYNGKEAGLIEKYEQNLSFWSFHNAAHMVPQDQPGPSYKMINQDLFGN